MKLMYLGTAAAEGVPAVFCRCKMCEYARKVKGKEVRTRSGALIDGVLKIDFPADAYMQELKHGLDYSTLQHVLITHVHEDHYCVKEFENRKYPYSQTPKTEPPLTLYGSRPGYDMIADALEEGVLEYRILTPYEPVKIMDYTVTPLPAVHAVSRNIEPYFYIIEKGDEALLYAHDTDKFTDEHLAHMKGKKFSLVSIDCTNGVLDVDYIGHMGIKDNILMREKLFAIGAADENTVFIANHFSHNGLVPHEEMEKRLPGFLVSYDGMIVENAQKA